MSMRITSAVPAAIDERKKEMGITGDHHCGASMFGISRYKDPSELWCIVDSVTAAMASMIGSAFGSRARKIHARLPKITAVAPAYARLRDIREMNSVTAAAT